MSDDRPDERFEILRDPGFGDGPFPGSVDVDPVDHRFVATEPVARVDLSETSAVDLTVDLTVGSAFAELDDPDPFVVVEDVSSPVDDTDPRFVERRAQVRSEGKRRRWRALASVLALLAVGGAAYGVVRSPMLDVDHIEIVGSSQLTVTDVARLTGVRQGVPLTFVEADRVRAQIAEDPRFLRVSVARRFPSTVAIRATDRRLIARVAGPTRAVIVGEGGVVIGRATGQELVRTITVSEDPPARPGSRLPARLAAAVDVMGSMSYEVAVQIVGVTLTPDGELVFDLGGDRTVYFGTVDDAEKKLLATRTMLGPQIDNEGLCELDVRVPAAPTIRRAPRCDPPAPAPAPDPAVAATAPAVPADSAPSDPSTAAVTPASTAAPSVDASPLATDPPPTTVAG